MQIDWIGHKRQSRLDMPTNNSWCDMVNRFRTKKTGDAQMLFTRLLMLLVLSFGLYWLMCITSFATLCYFLSRAFQCKHPDAGLRGTWSPSQRDRVIRKPSWVIASCSSPGHYWTVITREIHSPEVMMVWKLSANEMDSPHLPADAFMDLLLRKKKV